MGLRINLVRNKIKMIHVGVELVSTLLPRAELNSAPTRD
jgi:hypothetical protein